MAWLIFVGGIISAPDQQLPHLAQGIWTLVNAIDDEGKNWSNSVLEFTSQEETPEGLHFRGTFTWKRNNAFIGRENFTGDYIATSRQLIFSGISLEDVHGSLTNGSHPAVLSRDERTLIKGHWGVTHSKDVTAIPGQWSAFR